jgi:hypothetical protein
VCAHAIHRTLATSALVHIYAGGMGLLSLVRRKPRGPAPIDFDDERSSIRALAEPVAQPLAARVPVAIVEPPSDLELLDLEELIMADLVFPAERLQAADPETFDIGEDWLATLATDAAERSIEDSLDLAAYDRHGGARAGDTLDVP